MGRRLQGANQPIRGKVSRGTLCAFKPSFVRVGLFYTGSPSRATYRNSPVGLPFNHGYLECSPICASSVNKSSKSFDVYFAALSCIRPPPFLSSVTHVAEENPNSDQACTINRPVQRRQS